jgi:hypothetical protein
MQSAYDLAIERATGVPKVRKLDHVAARMVIGSPKVAAMNQDFAAYSQRRLLKTR